MLSEKKPYIGRFAPSPSGPLHFGSLITALGSYLQAKSNLGQWLVRIDDIDPPREMPGASEQICETLLAHGLQWDRSPLFQSTRSGAYQDALSTLTERNLTYSCRCTRKQIKQAGDYYTGACRVLDIKENNCSIRFKNNQTESFLDDVLLGRVKLNQAACSEDFIIKRKDGLIAYHLASVVDDIYLGVTEVVRGADLLQPTQCQVALFNAFDHPLPTFIHLPVASSAKGMKLSKQNHVSALSNDCASENLFAALQFLGQSVPVSLCTARPAEIVDWAVENWQLAEVPKTTEIIVNTAPKNNQLSDTSPQ